jgi:hypothetical protein
MFDLLIFFRLLYLSITERLSWSMPGVVLDLNFWCITIEWKKVPFITINTVATDRKSLWSQPINPSLPLCFYSGSTIATMVCSSDGHCDVRCPSLLWSVAATGTVTSGVCRCYRRSNDGRLTSRWPLLLGVIAATDNMMSNYQLLLIRFRFRHTYRNSQIQVYQTIIIRRIDKNWLNTSLNICSHR